MQTQNIERKPYQRIAKQASFETAGIQAYRLRPPRPGEHRVLNWISKHCRWPSGAGAALFRKPVGPGLLDFQKKIFTDSFHPDGRLKVPGIYLYGCRKVSKSFLFAAILFYLLCSRERSGLQLPVVGTSFMQGMNLFTFLREFAILSPDPIRSMLNVQRASITNTETGSKAFIVYQSPASNIGGKADCTTADDYGHHKSPENVDVVLSSMALAQEPLKLFSSNPPDSADHHALIKLSEAEREGWIVKRFSADPRADIYDPQSWRINPFIDEFFKTRGQKFKHVYRFYQSAFEAAKQSKESEASARRYLLGMACGVEGSAYFSPECLKVCDPNFEYPKGTRHAVGADLSLNNDCTSLAITSLAPDGRVFIYPLIFYPMGGRSKSKLMATKFKEWEQAGHIYLQPGPIEKEEILLILRDFLKKNKIKPEAFIFDPYAAQAWLKDVRDLNPVMTPYRPAELTPAIRTFQKAGEVGKVFLLKDNPCYRWHLSNVILSNKSKGYCLLNRLSDSQSIDAIVSTVLGLSYLYKNQPAVVRAWSV